MCLHLQCRPEGRRYKSVPEASSHTDFSARPQRLFLEPDLAAEATFDRRPHALCYIAIEQQCANSGQSQQQASRTNLTEAQLSNTEQSRINHGTPKRPGKQILAEVARLRQFRSQRSDATPPRHMRPYFPVEVEQNIIWLGGSQQRDQ